LRLLASNIGADILFFLLVNLIPGLILYALVNRKRPDIAAQVLIWLSAFFMAFNSLFAIFIKNISFKDMLLPLPAFVWARTIFYSLLIAFGTLLLRNYFVKKWQAQKAVRVLFCLLITAFWFVFVELAVNRIYFKFSRSLKPLLLNAGMLVGFVLLYLALVFLYKRLQQLWPRTMGLRDPLLPALVLVLLSLPALAYVLTSEKTIQHAHVPDKPNVVLISIDTLRADVLGCYGGEEIKTPNIDAFADSGLLFQHAYSQSPWTLVSIGSFMTGQYPTVNGLDRALKRLDSKRETISDAFHNAGYATVAVTTNGWNKPNFGMDQGFQDYRYQGDDFWTIHYASLLWYRVALKFVKYIEPEFKDRLNQPNSARSVTQEAITALNQYKNDSFFLWVHYIDPHDPYSPPRHLIRHKLRNYDGRYRFSSGPATEMRKGVMLKPEERRHVKDLYLGDVVYSDRQVGLLFKAIKDLGLDENTIVVLISDHGEEFWEHDGITHGHTLYNEVMHVPFIISWPEQIPAGVVDQQIALLDLKPTLLSLCGIDAQDVQQGIDLSTIIADRDTILPERNFFAEGLVYFEEKKGIFDGTFKYIVSEVSKRRELYDLGRDPQERHNLLLENPDLGDPYKQKLDEWISVSRDLHEKLPKSAGGSTAELDSETVNQLKALGYIN